MAIVKTSALWALPAAFFLVGPIALTGTARADIGLAPLRRVLTPENPTAVFTISNPSDRIMDGRVSWVDLKATETGYAPAAPETREALSAAPYLIVSPAQFRLKPGARMAVTVRIKNGARIPEGERRSHLLIETEASRTPIRKAGNSGLAVDIGVGVSAPVILRKGGKAKAEITDTLLLRDDDGLLMLETSVEPKGALSSFGRIAVSFTEAETGQSRILGVRENVAGYTDAARRKVTVPFGFVALKAGELTVRYEGAEEFEGVVFDQRVFDIAPPSDEN